MRKCARCGKTPPDGFASVSQSGVTKWYCHPDDGPDCYSEQGGDWDERMTNLLKAVNDTPAN